MLFLIKCCFLIQKTSAHRRHQDDVPLETKNERVTRLNQVFRQGAERINKSLIGSTQLVLVEGVGRALFTYC